MKDLLELFFVFMKIGSVAFGGGYAMLPILQKEFVEKRHWVNDQELVDYFAVGQCTPGVIAVNVSTFIGHKRKGVIGGIVATLGFVIIPIILLLVIATFLNHFSEYSLVKNAFAGIRIVVCILILNAIERLWKKSIVNKKALVLFGIIFLLTVFTSISPAILVICSAIVGIIIYQVGGNEK